MFRAVTQITVKVVAPTQPRAACGHPTGIDSSGIDGRPVVTGGDCHGNQRPGGGPIAQLSLPIFPPTITVATGRHTTGRGASRSHISPGMTTEYHHRRRGGDTAEAVAQLAILICAPAVSSACCGQPAGVITSGLN